MHGMRSVGKTDMGEDLRRQLFLATMGSVLLYGAETWTLTAQQERALDGVYTRMLQMALGVTWTDHIRNVVLYRDLPCITDKVRERSMRLS